jgi:hypothetical protein
MLSSSKDPSSGLTISLLGENPTGKDLLSMKL